MDRVLIEWKVSSMKTKRKLIAAIIVAVAAAAIITAVVFLHIGKPPTAKEVFDEAIKSVVEIKASADGVGESYGTAEFWDDDGTLVTNAHVVTYKKFGELHEFIDFAIRFAFEDDYRAAELIKYDTALDVAFLRLFDLTAPPKAIAHGDPGAPAFGDKVYAIGNGSNYGLSITQGIVSMPRVNIEYDGLTREAIQCDLTISAGNSGGALLDERGRLIGITAFRIKDSAGAVIYGIAYCIPISLVSEFYNA